MDGKPFSPACERNRDPILAVLREAFADRTRVLEIGSGTGQHAVHFAAAMPWLTWQASDVADMLPGIGAWLREAGLANTPPAIPLDVTQRDWLARPHPPSGHLLPQAGEGNSRDAAAQDGSGGSGRFDAAFSANTLHIMAWPAVEACFRGLDAALAADAVLVVYGPFNDDGRYTSDSNRVFDAWLQARDPASGLRDVGAVDALARGFGLHRVDDVAMPANNRCLIWRRGPGPRPAG
jgi:SAM-dependent methyltransferase